MKVGSGSFTLTHVATVFVPGSITLAAVALPFGSSRVLDVTNACPKWLLPFAFLIAVVLLGTVIGSVKGFFEAHVLDPKSSRRLNISKAVYDHQWYAYLASLPKYRNPYVTTLVDFFQFESRTAISLLFLTIGVTIQFGLSYGAPFWLTAVTYAMYRLGWESHVELARYRHHMYRSHMEAAGCALTPVPGLPQWHESQSPGTLWKVLRSIWYWL